MLEKNIEYYNINAESFILGTQNADMSLWRDKFESFVVDGGRIHTDDSAGGFARHSQQVYENIDGNILLVGGHSVLSDRLRHLFRA